MRDPAATCDSAGSTSDLAPVPCKLASAIAGDNGWKHFTKQVPISGQTFWGQLGQGLAGLWQGISSAVSLAVEWAAIDPAMARALDVVIGMAISAPSMATMPSTADH